MARPALEVADIFRDHGPVWRDANRSHVHVGQLKVMSAIESCRTAALGGHVVRCENAACGHTMLQRLVALHTAGKLSFHGAHAALAEAKAFAAFLKPLRRTRWFVYAKRPFGGPDAVLAYLARYTHRVAISNSRLVSADARGVTFKVKDYRIEGARRYKTMTLHPHEFIRRVLIHVLPKGFHRIRHTGFLASGAKAAKLAKARQLLAVPEPASPEAGTEVDDAGHVPTCPCCGGRMHVIETFERHQTPRHWPSPASAAIRIDTS